MTKSQLTQKILSSYKELEKANNAGFECQCCDGDGHCHLISVTSNGDIITVDHHGNYEIVIDCINHAYFSKNRNGYRREYYSSNEPFLEEMGFNNTHEKDFNSDGYGA